MAWRQWRRRSWQPMTCATFDAGEVKFLGKGTFGETWRVASIDVEWGSHFVRGQIPRPKRISTPDLFSAKSADSPSSTAGGLRDSTPRYGVRTQGFRIYFGFTSTM